MPPLKLLILALAFTATAALTNAQDLGALQQMLNTPAMQSQMAQTVAANPGLASSMLSTLSPSQTAVINTKMQAVSDKLFTPAERAKLKEFESSPEGASIIAKLPQLAQQMAPVLMQVYLSPAGAPAK